MKGYIKLHRSIQDNPVLTSDPGLLALWVHILLMASYTEREIMWDGQRLKLNPGQFLTSRKQLSLVSGLHESSVERKIKKLKKQQMIEQQSNSGSRLITVSNWTAYQEPEQQSNSHRTATEQPPNTINKDKKDDNGKERIKPPTPKVDPITELPLPENLSRDNWIGWVAYRKEIKKGMKKSTAEMQLKKLAKESDPGAILDKAILKGWIGPVFSDDQSQGAKPQANRIPVQQFTPEEEARLKAKHLQPDEE